MNVDKVESLFYGCLIWLAFFGVVAGIAAYCESKGDEPSKEKAAQPAMAFVIGGDKHLHTSIHGFMATNAEIKLLSKQDAENSDYRLCGECARRADIVDTYESIEQHTDSQYPKKPAVQTLFDSSGKEDLEEEPAYVWICTGTSSHAYHYYMDCIGLSSCKAEIDEISLEEAEKRGRTPCHLCREREATELDY